ncbi:hypothetical protein ABPG72_006089 [Tetrahymena utriculariae]
MFLKLLQNKQIPWNTINVQIDKIKYKGDPSYCEQREIELNTFNEKISRGLLASNLDELKYLKIRIKDPSGNLLNILMDTITKISCQPEELEFSLAFDYNEKMPDYKRMDYNSDQYVDSILQAIHYMGHKLKYLEVDFSSWSLAMDGINDKKVEKICQIFNFLPNLTSLRLSLFQWGLHNPDISGKSVINICEGIQKIKLTSLHLDLGRWGCTRHDTLNILEDNHVTIISQFLSSYNQLLHLNLNLRSWGYSNNRITIDSFKSLGEGLIQLNNLKTLAVNFFMWGYNNQRIQTDSAIMFFEIFNYQKYQAFQNLTSIKFIFKGFQYCLNSSINIFFKNLTTLPNLLRLSLNILGWQEVQVQISDEYMLKHGISKIFSKIQGPVLIDCPYLIEFEEVTHSSYNKNIKQYYPVRKKLQHRKNIMKLIQLMKYQKIKKQVLSSDHISIKPESMKELHSESEINSSLTQIFRKEVVFELLEEYLI